MAFDLDRALADTLRVSASDLHLKVPSPPRIRVAGRLVDLPGYEPLTPEDTAAIKELIVTSELKRADFERTGSADFSHWTDHGRFRVSAFSQRGSASFVFRTVPVAPDAEKLGLPDTVVGWAAAKRGLIVVTGPTGSGKSTTCAAIIDRINGQRPCHVLTIEDPIEFLHADRQAIVSQREIGLDAPSYDVALRAAMRQDPDVVMVGEIRDEETAMTALRAAETGHLVLCTMHTIDATETVQRLVDLFGDARAGLARQMIGATLIGVCSQRLLPAANGGMALNAELLVNTARVRGLIVGGAAPSTVHDAIAEGEYYGMATFDQRLTDLVRSGRVKETDALDYASDSHDFKLLLEGAGGAPVTQAEFAPGEPPAAASLVGFTGSGPRGR